MDINFGPTLENLDVLGAALLTTVTLFFGTFAVSIIPAGVVAVLRVHGPRIVGTPLTGLVYAVRGVPAVLSVIVIFYSLPFIGIVLSAYTSVMLTLVLVQTVYMSEVFRAALEAIDKGQFEAASSVGLSTWKTLRHVIFPQAAVIAAPAFISSAILLMQNTTVAQGVGLYDLLGRAQNIAVNTLDGSSIIIVAPVYAIILVPLVRLARRAETRLARRAF
jgi:polar amino acid transport system permease protein